ncbi:zinc-binding alcohol dehydrogenase family protein [Cytophagaceae bacterium YF14B1]|uniref:Zinc-binding alcohol dehydrogenase family protein n=1 Tax=Xanthocytophaga flava TaxID=3048013 RepID=A0AAE3UB43_9BACT|nr:zinc-binding alcohol dehydrogenase family protein [Xanthocytophaga flavus]MDJ1484008.1 zinc-binding alcohol dehydrogenase family protein [Xanthocytophaga flavus]
MKTIVLNQPGELHLTSRDVDDVLSDNEALIRIHRIGICGTDYHAYRGKQPFFSYPRVLGHELGAEVVALGKSVDTKQLEIGNKVAVEPYLNCGHCQACQNGKSNCCENLKVMGVHTDGGMCEYVKIPANKLHRSTQLGYEQLALVETLGIGAHAVQRAQVSANDIVLVIGAGPIGLSVIQFAKIQKAQVAVMDFSTQRLEFAKQAMHTDYSITATTEFNTNDLRKALGGKLPTIVFDATGNSQSMMKAFSYLAFGGKLVYVGLFQGDVTFFDPDFHRKEVTLFASRNSLPSDFKNIIQQMESGQINTQAWLTHQAAFEELPSVFETWLNPESHVIKAMVVV